MATARSATMEVSSNIRRWNMKKLIKNLEENHGNGTSLLSIMIPHGRGQLTRMTRLLTDELGTSSQIKSKTNRLSVQSAIVSVQKKLSLYNSRMPENGLVVYCGAICDDGKERKVNIDFEPPESLVHSLYFCGSHFNVEPLKLMLEQENSFGFIIMDGHGCLFGSVRGNSRQVLHRFKVVLPGKHRRGGQSAARFGRLRDEKRHNYVKKVAETSEQVFLSGPPERQPIVKGIILAGSAEFKSTLHMSPLFDQKLRNIVIQEVDVSYGGVSGFNEAIELSKDALGNVRFVQERRILSNFFELLMQEQSLSCLGVKECMSLIGSGVIETLIVWEDLDMQRYQLRNNGSGEDRVVFLSKKESLDKRHFVDKNTGVELELVEQDDLVEWLTFHHTEFGLSLELVSDSSTEGHQLVHGLGGMGAILRYAVETEIFENDDEEDIDDYDIDEY